MFEHLRLLLGKNTTNMMLPRDGNEVARNKKIPLISLRLVESEVAFSALFRAGSRASKNVKPTSLMEICLRQNPLRLPRK
jgi:hypothetical protein